MNHPYPWLKYVVADRMHAGNAAFDGMRVESPTGEKLGSVDGFIVDADSPRPYYVVVDAGGWFKSRHFLLPVGHAAFSADPGRDALVADISRERIDRFPGFDKDEFDTLTPISMKRLNDEICGACGAELKTYPPDESYATAWDRADYRYPDWWHAEPSLPEHMGNDVDKEMVEYPPQETIAAKK